MTEVWVYVVGANSDPDHVCCKVPWRVDRDLIFFGPCMKDMRKKLRDCFLEKDKKDYDPIYIVGVNGYNWKRKRKIIWAGKLSEVMTFAEADSRLNKGDRFQKLRNHPRSPLHMRPLMENRKLIGYEHVSELHSELKNGDEKWILDLVSAQNFKISASKIKVQGRQLLLRQGAPRETFDLDCCLLLSNIFFARGQGINFDEEALDILRRAQKPEKSSGINSYAIFGLKRNGHADPLRRKWLEIKDEDGLASRFIAWLGNRARPVVEQQGHEKVRRAQTNCS